MYQSTRDSREEAFYERCNLDNILNKKNSQVPIYESTTSISPINIFQQLFEPPFQIICANLYHHSDVMQFNLLTV